jgi:HEAT repeat protein
MRDNIESYSVQNFYALSNIVNDLFSKNYLLRRKAREEMLDIGEPGLNYLIQLANSHDESIRWEAIKLIEQIGNDDIISVLIDALEDNEFSIRWLASEGIIKMGKYAINPLLESLTRKQSSRYLKRGVHHILKELRRNEIFKDNYGLVEAIANDYEEPILLMKIKQTLRTI